ncbi:hypothetical protein K432DRAFT_395919 [Lepidopterella palustris CBS 459.81]|uniref:Uncharacterized protein n=1 Tax=Lepidopterella palustris CBS 459.81 TaxID=1314670 RepID=A0A8E2JC86_9PEZI|nr:hypothetical protein K432DRAFT_395919 [Lepidopterella palustris CBS 459.81]
MKDAHLILSIAAFISVALGNAIHANAITIPPLQITTLPAEPLVKRQNSNGLTDNLSVVGYYYTPSTCRHILRTTDGHRLDFPRLVHFLRFYTDMNDVRITIILLRSIESVHIYLGLFVLLLLPHGDWQSSGMYSDD